MIMIPRQQLLVFTDLDGTLLDHDTYAFDAARPAMERLGRAGVPLVLCTSKTRAEVEPLREAMENDSPFIVENGGAIFIPDGYFATDIDIPDAKRWGDMLVVPMSDPYSTLVAALARASRESGVRVRGFADMTDADVATATGLSLDDAHRARQRDFDEPFEILDADRADALLAAIEREGKRWTKGGRFHHITGASDKAAAVIRLTELYRRQTGAVTTVGVGDAPNDAAFLREMDIPIVMESPRAAEMVQHVPRATVTSVPGPVGWNMAMHALLDSWR
jgi:mannosyl-3-phosphoglycerate phosphatase